MNDQVRGVIRLTVLEMLKESTSKENIKQMTVGW